MRKAGGDPKAAPYLRYTFETVFVTKINWGGSGDDIPSEHVTFQFGQVAIKYQPQTQGGSNVLAPYWKSAVLSTAAQAPCLWCPQ
jgi:type VI protein secretion system component Hcp